MSEVIAALPTAIGIALIIPGIALLDHLVAAAHQYAAQRRRRR